MPLKGVNEERMGKKRNMLKRNSGFIIGCVIAAGASFFTADLLTSDCQVLQVRQTETAAESENAKETVPEERGVSRTYETDAFTVLASGMVVKGAESEISEDGKKIQKPWKNGDALTPETDENGNVLTPESDETESVPAPETDENGNLLTPEPDENSEPDYDGLDENYYDQPVEITDPGGGEYYYNGGGTDDGGGNGDNEPGTPDDVIISGISSRYIAESELYDYDVGQLRLIRNEIFALHGRIFKSQDLKDYFSRKSWYVPKYDPDEFDAHMFEYLNDYEEANLQVILNYEAALAGN